MVKNPLINSWVQLWIKIRIILEEDRATGILLLLYNIKIKSTEAIIGELREQTDKQTNKQTGGNEHPRERIPPTSCVLLRVLCTLILLKVIRVGSGTDWPPCCTYRQKGKLTVARPAFTDTQKVTPVSNHETPSLGWCHVSVDVIPQSQLMSSQLVIEVIYFPVEVITDITSLSSLTLWWFELAINACVIDWIHEAKTAGPIT